MEHIKKIREYRNLLFNKMLEGKMWQIHMEQKEKESGMSKEKFEIYVNSLSNLLGDKKIENMSDVDKDMLVKAKVRLKGDIIISGVVGEIEKAPMGLLPDQALANALAKKWAMALRKRMKDLF